VHRLHAQVGEADLLAVAEVVMRELVLEVLALVVRAEPKLGAPEQ
jgi:hypothetical protein